MRNIKKIAASMMFIGALGMSTVFVDAVLAQDKPLPSGSNPVTGTMEWKATAGDDRLLFLITESGEVEINWYRMKQFLDVHHDNTDPNYTAFIKVLVAVHEGTWKPLP